MKVHVLLAFMLISCSSSTHQPSIFESDIYKKTPVNKLVFYVDNAPRYIPEYCRNNPKLNIDYADPYYDMSLLMYSIINCKKQSFDALLTIGANPNFVNNKGETPLIISFKYYNNYSNSNYFIQQLIDSGANLYLSPKGVNESAYSYASRDINAIKILIKNGLNISNNDIYITMLNKATLYNKEAKDYLLFINDSINKKSDNILLP